MNARTAFVPHGIACLALLALAPAAHAQSADRAGTWETRLDIVYQNSSDWDFDGGTTAEVDSDNLELGGNLTFGQTDYTPDIDGFRLGIGWKF